MSDMENVIKGLENLRETIRNATQYTFTSGGICAMNMKRIDNAIALLKDQPEIVRCKNCKYNCGRGHDLYYQFIECEKTGTFHEGDWFCADGKEK